MIVVGGSTRTDVKGLGVIVIMAIGAHIVLVGTMATLTVGRGKAKEVLVIIMVDPEHLQKEIKSKRHNKPSA